MKRYDKDNYFDCPFYKMKIGNISKCENLCNFKNPNVFSQIFREKNIACCYPYKQKNDEKI